MKSKRHGPVRDLIGNSIGIVRRPVFLWLALPAALALVAGLAALHLGFARDVPLDGPYRLVAVDIDDDMALCRSVGTIGDCVGDGLPDATIFQAGVNARYVVVARHPRHRWTEAPDRSVTEYYYVVRSPDEANPRTPLTIVGPMDKLQYDRESQRLGLPEFTKVFDNLK
jgi:hypothetical protein